MNDEQFEDFRKCLPIYLQKDIKALEDAIKNNNKTIDCEWCELYGSINSALHNDNAITEEEAKYLRDKYL